MVGQKHNGNTGVSAILGPAEGYWAVVSQGEALCKTDSLTLFMQSLYGGCFMGIAGLLALSIAGNIPGAVTMYGSGIQTFVYAALFPIGLLLVLLFGAILFTGTVFNAPAAFIEGRASLLHTCRVIAISWVGNLLGGFLFATFVEGCDLDQTGVSSYAMTLLTKKTSKTFGQTFLRGIGCNWLVCIAVYFFSMSKDLTGKYVGIWVPVSAFVASGFEHFPANAFALTLGWSAARKDPNSANLPTGLDVFVKNWIPATLGNAFAGVIIMAYGYSFFYGRFGSCPFLSRPAALIMSASHDESNGSTGTKTHENHDAESPAHESLDAESHQTVIQKDTADRVTNV